MSIDGGERTAARAARNDYVPIGRLFGRPMEISHVTTAMISADSWGEFVEFPSSR